VQGGGRSAASRTERRLGAPVAAEPFDLDGVASRSGQFVTPSSMSAMRDETVYSQPDAFDIHRPDGRPVHLIFMAARIAASASRWPGRNWRKG